MPPEEGWQPPDPDDFDRELQELISGRAGSGRIRELSAADRAKQAAKLRAKQAAKLQAKQVGRRRPGRRLLVIAKMSGVFVAVALTGWGLYVLHGRFNSVSQPGQGLAPPTATPTANSGRLITPRHAAPAFTAADPFAGTPAEGFASGAAGIVLPAAKPVRGYRTDQVRAAYATTRQLLIAANLDWPTLQGGPPDAFSKLLNIRQQAQFLGGLDRAPAADGQSRATRSWVVSFAPGSTAFVGSVIKVHGGIAAMTATDKGRPVLRIRFNYLFVYPVQRPGRPQTRVRVVAHLIGHADFARWTDPGGPLQPWWLAGGPALAGAQCGTTDGYVHPAFPATASSRVTPSPTGTPIDPYQLRNQHLTGKCFLTTGT